MTTRRSAILFFVAMFGLLGCPAEEEASVGDATAQAGQNPDDGNPPPPEPELTDTPIIYLVTSSSSSDYVSQYDITLEADYQTIIRFVPEADFADVVDRNHQPSFAGDGQIVPYTVDDRFFVRDEWEGLDAIGHHDFTESDPISGEHLGFFRANNPYYYTSGCSAVVGQAYYYESTRTWDFLHGELDGDFRVLNSVTGSDVILNAYGTGSLDECKGNLWADDGALFDGSFVVFDDDPTVRFAIFDRDLASGDLAGSKVLSVLAETHVYDEFSYNSGVSNGIGYIVRKRSSDDHFEIWRGAMGGVAQLVFEGKPGRMTEINQFDVDDGYVVIGDQRAEQILLYDHSTGAATVYDTGVSFYDIQVLNVKE